MQLSSRCPFCKLQEETINHLFVSCVVVEKIWQYIWKDSMVGSVENTNRWEIIEHKGKQIWTTVGEIYWDSLFHANVWGIWMERNQRQFEEWERSTTQIICDIKDLI